MKDKPKGNNMPPAFLQNLKGKGKDAMEKKPTKAAPRGKKGGK